MTEVSPWGMDLSAGGRHGTVAVFDLGGATWQMILSASESGHAGSLRTTRMGRCPFLVPAVLALVDEVERLAGDDGPAKSAITVLDLMDACYSGV